MSNILPKQFQPDTWDTEGDPVKEFHDREWGFCTEGDCILLAKLRELEAQLRADERGRHP